MDLKTKTLEFVELKGFREAAKTSTDIQLVAILDYLNMAASYFEENDLKEDVPIDIINQLRVIGFQLKSLAVSPSHCCDLALGIR